MPVPARHRDTPGRDSVVLPPHALHKFAAGVCTRLGAGEDIAEVVAEGKIQVARAAGRRLGVPLDQA